MPTSTWSPDRRPAGRWRSVAVPLALVLLLAGCGEDDDPGDTTSSTQATSATTSEPETSAPETSEPGEGPLIRVTSPQPGEAVDGSVQVEGTANTFEATVLYEVLGPTGEVLDEGFTTATAGSGTWGDFSFEATWDTGVTGEGTLVLFQEDMESGGRRDVVEVPLQLGG
jgi:hypothetical protein